MPGKKVMNRERDYPGFITCQLTSLAVILTKAAQKMRCFMLAGKVLALLKARARGRTCSAAWLPSALPSAG